MHNNCQERNNKCYRGDNDYFVRYAVSREILPGLQVRQPDPCVGDKRRALQLLRSLLKYLPKLPRSNNFESSVCCDQLKDVVQLRNIFFPGSGGRERFVRDSRANIMVKGIKMKKECHYRHAVVGNLLQCLFLFLPNGSV